MNLVLDVICVIEYFSFISLVRRLESLARVRLDQLTSWSEAWVNRLAGNIVMSFWKSPKSLQIWSPNSLQISVRYSFLLSHFSYEVVNIAKLLFLLDYICNIFEDLGVLSCDPLDKLNLLLKTPAEEYWSVAPGNPPRFVAAVRQIKDIPAKSWARIHSFCYLFIHFFDIFRKFVSDNCFSYNNIKNIN